MNCTYASSKLTLEEKKREFGQLGRKKSRGNGQVLVYIKTDWMHAYNFQMVKKYCKHNTQ